MNIPSTNSNYYHRYNLVRDSLFFAGVLLTLSVALLSRATTASATTQPELPRVFLDTTYVPPTGRMITVNANGDLQAALDSAAPGDVIALEAGAIFTGNFVLPYKSGSDWITIRSSAPDDSLPPPGVRITPAYAGAMPKLISPDDVPALRTEARAHHYRLIGIEFGYLGGDNYGLLQLGDGDETSPDQLPNNLILDRCYIHGNATGQAQNGIRLNSASTAIIDSYISNIHAIDFESHAIAGYFGPGPYKIVNNYLEASAVNVLFGGATPRINGLVPSDIELRRNHFSKRLSWKQDDPSYGGTPWMCKNLFELKSAQRVLIEGNIFERNWPSGPTADGGPQHGWAILFTVRDEGRLTPWAVVQDVTFTSNVVRHSNCGFLIYGSEGRGLRRIKIANNLLDDIGPRWGNNNKTGYAAQVSDAADLSFDHNTIIQSAAILWVYNSPVVGFTFTNNIAPHNLEGVDGETSSPGLNTLNTYFPGYMFLKNALVDASPSAYPANNFFPVTLDHVGFVDRANGNYRLAPASPYKKAGMDGKDLGADFDAIDAAISGRSGNVAPAVSVTSPASGAIFAEPASVTVTADAADRDGAISLVEFYAGTSLIGSDTTAPYSVIWNNVAAGSYSLTAKATDNAGATATSSPVNITVNGDGGQPPPAAPSDLAVTAVSGGQLNLTWKDNSDNETGFKIEQSTDGFIYTQTGAVSANVTSYSVTGLTSRKLYWFRVKACNYAGCSTASNPVRERAR